MKTIIFQFIAIFGICCNINADKAPEVKTDGDVLVLTESNFDHVIANNKHVLVEFYAPWCGHCKALEPEYAKAATSLKDGEISAKLAKVDATVETSLAKKYGVRGYPTLKFFKHEKPIEYKDAPWCGPCVDLNKQLATVAQVLKREKPNVRIGKVDGSKEETLIQKLQVNGYPTIVFMQYNGRKMNTYSGGRKADDILDWIKKKTGPPCKILTTEDDLKSFRSDNEVAVIAHYANAEHAHAKSFEDIAGSIDDLPFAFVFDAGLAARIELPINNVVLFKKDGKGGYLRMTSKLTDDQLSVWIIRHTSPLVQEMGQEFDEGRADYEGDVADTEALTAFVKANQMRLVSEFTQESAPRIFGGNIHIHSLLFVSKSSGDFEKHLEAFKQAAAEFKGKVLFIFINVDKEENKRILEFFGLSSGDIPDYRVIKMSDNMAKFKPDKKEFTKEAFISFTQSVLDGKAARHLMSQEVPADWDKNPVAVLVGKNFKEVAFDKSKKVFVEFYAPWCGHCKKLKPIYEKLGENYKDNKDVVIAMIDATANEIEGFEVSGFPTLKFVPSGSDKVIDYTGDRTVEAMSEFIDSNGAKVGDDDAGEEEVDQIRPTTSPLPPLETAPGGGVAPNAESDFKKIEDSMDPNLKIDNIKAKMMEDLKKMESEQKKKAEL